MKRLVVLTVALVMTASAAFAGAQDDVIESYSLTLDRRCHVAVVSATLSRRVPIGIKVQGVGSGLVGRVPFGRKTTLSKGAFERTVVWDLRVEDRYLKPGRYTTRLRALDRRGERVIDRSPRVKLKIPRSFASPPTRCGD